MEIEKPEVEKKFRDSSKRIYLQYAREDLLLSLLRMFEHVEEHRHITNDHLEQEWLVVPMDKFERTLKSIEKATLEISEELSLNKPKYKSLAALMNTYAELRKEKKVA
jgi:hypothetical protein